MAFTRAASTSLLSLTMFSGVAAAQSFTLLSSPVGILGEWARGISADGSTVVGESFVPLGGGYFWNADTGKRVYGDFADNTQAQRTLAVSGDGLTAVGEAGFRGSSTPSEAYRYREGGQLEMLGRLPQYQSARAQGANHDASVIAGITYTYFENIGEVGQAFRWTEETGMVGLGFLPGQPGYSEATAVSRDGSTIVGYGYGGTGYRAFVWTEANGMQALPGAGDPTQSRLMAANFNGDILVGDTPGAQSLATMWIGGVPTSLGTAPGFFHSQAAAVNDLGTVVGGHVSGGSPGNGQQAAVWTPEHGMETLANYLAHFNIAIPAGVNPYTVTGVSADGTVLCGYTGGGNGIQGWVAVTPTPATLCLLAAVAPLHSIHRRRRSTRHLAPPTIHAPFQQHSGR